LAAGLIWLGVIFCWFDRYALSRTHVALSGAVSTLDRSPDLVRHAQCDSVGDPKAWPSNEYAILAMLLWRALRSGTRWQMKMWILLLVTALASAIFAASDGFINRLFHHGPHRQLM